MIGKVTSACVYGIEGLPIEVEADISSGLPSFDMVGFLASEVKEARERVRTAIKNSGLSIPPRRITINLSPADRKKKGSSFDLAIAAALLSALEVIPANNLSRCMVFGELSLDGQVRAIPGVLSMVLSARKNNISCCILPWDNRMEGSSVDGIHIIGIRTLSELIKVLNSRQMESYYIEHASFLDSQKQEPDVYPDLSDLLGQKALKSALETAASGMHNLLMSGPPGSGKTMAARCLPGILPPLSHEESLELTQIYSICGYLPPGSPLMSSRPFRTPHHTIRATALAGGGSSPRPGEISLAHRGILFLDELTEFPGNTLEVLRQPLEDREITISRLHNSCTFPADVMLVGAINPCRCGYYPDRNKCTCTQQEIKKHIGRLSKALLDRIDISIEVPRLQWEELKAKEKEESSAVIRNRVIETQQRQAFRFQEENIHFNSQMKSCHIKMYCRLGEEESQLLSQFYENLSLTARSCHRLLRVARTLADMDQQENIQCRHLIEASCFRLDFNMEG